jgi:hypothetical protein
MHSPPGRGTTWTYGGTELNPTTPQALYQVIP